MVKAVLALSGGLDSAAAWWALGKSDWMFVTPAHPIASARECEAVTKLCELDRAFADCGNVLNVSLLPFMRPGGWCFPRKVLLSCLAVGLGYEEILFAYHAWDTAFEGNTPERMTEFLRFMYGFKSLTVHEPLRGVSRLELLDRARAAGCPDEFLLATWSCQRAGELHCGACINCVERHTVLSLRGIDPGFELHASEAQAQEQAAIGS